MKHLLWIPILGLLLLTGFAFAQTEEDLNNSSLDGVPPIYDVQIIEHGSSALGHIHEFNILDSKGNDTTCIVLEDQLSCYINNVFPN